MPAPRVARGELLKALRLKAQGQDPWALESLRAAETELARFASARPGAPLRGMLASPRPRRLGLGLGGEPELCRLAGLRAAGILGEARFRNFLVEFFLSRSWPGGRR